MTKLPLCFSVLQLCSMHQWIQEGACCMLPARQHTLFCWRGVGGGEGGKKRGLYWSLYHLHFLLNFSTCSHFHIVFTSNKPIFPPGLIHQKQNEPQLICRELFMAEKTACQVLCWLAACSILCFPLPSSIFISASPYLFLPSCVMHMLCAAIISFALHFYVVYQRCNKQRWRQAQRQ